MNSSFVVGQSVIVGEPPSALSPGRLQARYSARVTAVRANRIKVVDELGNFELITAAQLATGKRTVDVADGPPQSEARTQRLAQVGAELVRRQLSLDDDFVCSICLDEPEDAVQTHCLHVFCRQCLRDYLRSSTTSEHGDRGGPCPLCRTVLKASSLESVEIKKRSNSNNTEDDEKEDPDESVPPSPSAPLLHSTSSGTAVPPPPSAPPLFSTSSGTAVPPPPSAPPLSSTLGGTAVPPPPSAPPLPHGHSHTVQALREPEEAAQARRRRASVLAARGRQRREVSSEGTAREEEKEIPPPPRPIPAGRIVPLPPTRGPRNCGLRPGEVLTIVGGTRDSVSIGSASDGEGGHDCPTRDPTVIYADDDIVNSMTISEVVSALERLGLRTSTPGVPTTARHATLKKRLQARGRMALSERRQTMRERARERERDYASWAQERKQQREWERERQWEQQKEEQERQYELSVAAARRSVGVAEARRSQHRASYGDAGWG